MEELGIVVGGLFLLFVALCVVCTVYEYFSGPDEEE